MTDAQKTQQSSMDELVNKVFNAGVCYGRAHLYEEDNASLIASLEEKLKDGDNEEMQKRLDNAKQSNERCLAIKKEVEEQLKEFRKAFQCHIEGVVLGAVVATGTHSMIANGTTATQFQTNISAMMSILMKHQAQHNA